MAGDFRISRLSFAISRLRSAWVSPGQVMCPYSLFASILLCFLVCLFILHSKNTAQYTLMCRTSCRNVYSHQIMFKVSCLFLPPKSIPRISFLLLRNIPRSRRLLPMYLGLPSDAFPGKKRIVSHQQGSQCRSRQGVSPYTDRTQLFFFHLPVRSHLWTTRFPLIAGWLSYYPAEIYD